MSSYSSELTDGTGLRFQAETTKVVTTKHSMKAINICLWFCATFGALVGLCYLVFDPLVKHVVLKRLILSNNSETSEIWENPPITPHFKVYLFNLTNPEGVFNGTEIPRLVEVGPYVYQGVIWHNNGTMSYKTRKVFSYQRELSVGDHSVDKILTLNVPLLTAYYRMRNSIFFAQYGLESVAQLLEYQPWVEKTPEELIWGYDESLFELAKFVGDGPPTNKFGFFSAKNDSNDLSTYTMYTGENNPYDLSKISSFNGKSHLNFWKNDECNLVRGSDGSTFNPYISKSDTLWFFNDQLCRSLPLVYDQEVMSRSLPGYRFKPRYDVYKSPSTVPENDCYCTDQTLCDMIGDGMFAVSACQFDAPIILSWPHFLGANSSYQSSVEGLSPQLDSHGFWFDIQPTTGTTMSARARIQINLAVKNIPAFSQLEKVKDIIMPILWFDEGIEELGSELTEVIGQAVLTPPIYKNYIFCIFLGFCASTFVIFLVALIRFALNKSLNHTPSEGICRDNLIRNLGAQLNNPQVRGTGLCKSHHDDDGASAPMLPPSDPSSACSSTDSSRLTTANHSRNSSTGSTLSSSAVVITQDSSSVNIPRTDSSVQILSETSSIPTNYDSASRLKSLLNPKKKLPNTDY
nr:lysosome membrane protein 2-like isoform X2 [Lepeophtheirus salmonis]